MSAQAAFLEALFARLWRKYAERVPYARRYEAIVRKHRGCFRNDHVAFRTFAAQRPGLGGAALSRPFSALGYRAAGLYAFPEKKLSSTHYAPPLEGLPKLFISELRLWELSPRARRIILKNIAASRPALGDSALADLARLPALGARRRAGLLDAFARSLSRPWAVPARADVLALEKETQFGAWTLLHGHSVNHFTAAVHAQGVLELDGIEKTISALERDGVPMKPEIEGAPGSKLRQSSTQPALLPTPMRVGRTLRMYPWPYAYFELAERPLIDGRRFEGFLGPQAANLFEMTRRS